MENKLSKLSPENKEIIDGVIELCRKVRDGTANHMDKKRYQVIKGIKYAYDRTLNDMVSGIAYDRTEDDILKSKGHKYFKSDTPEMIQEAEGIYNKYMQEV